MTKARKSRIQIKKQNQRLQNALNHRGVNEGFDGGENNNRADHQNHFAELRENDKSRCHSRFAAGDGDGFQKCRENPKPNDNTDFWCKFQYFGILEKFSEQLRIEEKRKKSDAARRKIENQNI